MLLLMLQPPCYEANNPAGAVDYFVADFKTQSVPWLVGLSDVTSRTADERSMKADDPLAPLGFIRKNKVPFPDTLNSLFAVAELESNLLPLLLEVCLALSSLENITTDFDHNITESFEHTWSHHACTTLRGTAASFTCSRTCQHP